jgi:hypothetical protein
LIVRRAKVVRVVLGSGRFDWEDTVLTLETLLFLPSVYCPSFDLGSITGVFALEDSKTPFFTG